MSRFFLKLMTLTCIACLITACSSKNRDFIPDKKPDELYIEAYKAMTNEDYSHAREYLEAIDSRYPFGPYSHQVQLDLIYTYYKDRENQLALAEIDKFIRLNPADPNIDYVLYIRGLTNLQLGTDRLLDFIHIDRYDRDSSYHTTAFNDFKTLYTRYPNSLYAPDAYARMAYIQKTLARYELKIANYYYDKEAYLSSARRCQKIILTFKDTDEVELAMKLLVKNYKKLNLPNEAQRWQNMIDINFDDK